MAEKITQARIKTLLGELWDGAQLSERAPPGQPSGKLEAAREAWTTLARYMLGEDAPECEIHS